MKIILAICFLMAVPAYGQRVPFNNDSKNSLTLSWGAISSDFIFAGNIAEIFGGDKNSYSNNKYCGTFCLTWKYLFSKRCSIGITAVYENMKGSWFENTTGYQYGGDIFVGSFKRNLFTIGPEVAFIYRTTHSGLMKIYGAVGFGYTFYNEVDTYNLDYYYSKYKNGVNTLGKSIEKENNANHFNGQITGLGIRYGSQLAFNLELGFGYKGIVNAGLTLNLD
jgi:hypothetical protein